MSEIKVGDLWVSSYSSNWVVRIKDFYKQDGTVEYLDDDNILESSHVTSFIEDFMFLEKPKPKHSHYHKDVSQYDTMDIYAICKVWNVESSGCTFAAVKKLLNAGERGAKDRITDLEQAIGSIEALIKLVKMDVE
ncbi:hypothetical protein [Psychrobacter sp. BI730]|uniref:hypothetical protein n=1 Tax=Psychrobacter sp. BI730 TaxID=2705463 RepID=UPI0015CE1B6D|nr:hypothetical protein [Psychrobacter sp. BI730]NYR09587.1 hypothetical protein [Psychrobacter sp. BI730]